MYGQCIYNTREQCFPSNILILQCGTSVAIEDHRLLRRKLRSHENIRYGCRLRLLPGMRYHILGFRKVICSWKATVLRRFDTVTRKRELELADLIVPLRYIQHQLIPHYYKVTLNSIPVEVCTQAMAIDISVTIQFTRRTATNIVRKNIFNRMRDSFRRRRIKRTISEPIRQVEDCLVDDDSSWLGPPPGYEARRRTHRSIPSYISGHTIIEDDVSSIMSHVCGPTTSDDDTVSIPDCIVITDVDCVSPVNTQRSRSMSPKRQS